MAEEKKDAAVAVATKQPEKMVRVFYRKGRTDLVLIPEEKRLDGSKNAGFIVHFRKCEAFIPEKHLHLLKATRRYGVDYLTQDDFFALGEKDARAQDSFVDQMKDWCKDRQKEPPLIKSRYSA